MQNNTTFENYEIPKPPFLGWKCIREISPADLLEKVNLTTLFRQSWGARNASGAKWDKLFHQFSIRLSNLRESLSTNPWIKASALYGYWSCAAKGDQLLVLDPRISGDQEIVRFAFPRQAGGGSLCLADFFKPHSTGVKDVVAFQLVTLGNASADYVKQLNETAGISEAYYAHGLAVQLTEAAARWIHSLIREELDLAEGQGKRYSWGFPAIPDLSQHQLLFKLLPAEKELGIHLTSAYQFIPEYTTAAMIIHHPDAKYFRME